MKLLTLLSQIYYNHNNHEKPWYEEWWNAIENSPYWYSALGVIILIWIFKKSEKDYHSHWNTLLDNFSFSSEEFYNLLKKELYSHGIKEMSMVNKNLNEDSLGLTKRKYLRISWKDYEYYICGAPFGKGFFVSWHLVYDDSGVKVFISKVPFIGNWLAKRLFYITFYKRDTASMFMTYAQQSVLNVIGQITNEKGIRELSEQDQKPILGNIFKR